MKAKTKRLSSRGKTDSRNKTKRLSKLLRASIREKGNKKSRGQLIASCSRLKLSADGVIPLPNCDTRLIITTQR